MGVLARHVSLPDARHIIRILEEKLVLTVLQKHTFKVLL